MADKPQETKGQNGGSGAEAAARAGGQAAEATERGGRGAAQATRRAGEAGGQMMRHGGDAGADAMRHLGSTAGEAMQRGSAAAAEGQRSLAQSAAAQWEDLAERMAMAVQESARDLRALFALPGVSRDGMQDVREGMSGFVEGVMRTNMRMVQELFRMASPTYAIDMQRRFGGEYLETLLESSAILMRGTRRAADDALRPLEQRVGQRREARHGCVADVMRTEIRLASPDDTVQQAAQMMRESDAGALPVGEGDRLVGMVTDRDVAVRLVAEGRDPRQTRVREVMTPDVRYVFEDEELDDVAENMAEQHVRGLPVMTRDKRLVGVISLGDLERRGRARPPGRTHSGIARESAQHSAAAE